MTSTADPKLVQSDLKTVSCGQTEHPSQEPNNEICPTQVMRAHMTAETRAERKMIPDYSGP